MPKRSSHFRTGKTKEQHSTPPPSLNRGGSRDQERETKLPEVTQRVGQVETGTRARTSESLPGRERASPSLLSSGPQPSAWRCTPRSPGRGALPSPGQGVASLHSPDGRWRLCPARRRAARPGCRPALSTQSGVRESLPPTPAPRRAVRWGRSRVLGPMALRPLPAPARPGLLARHPAPASPCPLPFPPFALRPRLLLLSRS